MKKMAATAIFVLVTLVASGYWLEARAQDASPSAEVSEEEVKLNVKERLEKVAGASTIKRAWIGTIADITNHTLSLKTGDLTRQVEVSESAKIIGLDRQSLKISDLEIGKFVIAMGFLNDTGVLDGRRIVLADPPSSPTYTAQILTFSSLTLKPNKDTTITQTQDGQLTEIEASDLKPDDQVITIASTKTLTHIHLLDSRPILSASPSASPSASAKP